MSRPLCDRITGSALTDVGLTRRENQDACALFSTRGHALVAVVADGMGGHSGGSLASQLAVGAIQDNLAETQLEIDDTTLSVAIERANTRILERASEDPDLRGMGTTVVALLVHPDGRSWVAHVGDSRAYRLRDHSLEPLTSDHSVVAELVRSGVLSKEEAKNDSRRNEILRSVGVAPSVQVEVSEVSIRPGDRFLLCSDGLTGPVDEDQIALVLAQHDPENAALRLIARANEAGGPDNVTAIALHYPDPDGDTDTPHFHSQERSAPGEAELIAAERAEARLSRARRLLWVTVFVGLALLVSVVALFATGTV